MRPCLTQLLNSLRRGAPATQAQLNPREGDPLEIMTALCIMRRRIWYARLTINTKTSRQRLSLWWRCMKLLVIRSVDLGNKTYTAIYNNPNPSPLYPWRGLLKINLGWSTVNTRLPRDAQLTVPRVHTINPLLYTCFAIVKRKLYWPISELSVSMHHAEGGLPILMSSC